MNQQNDKPMLMLVHSYSGFVEWLDLVPYRKNVSENYLNGAKSELHMELATLSTRDGVEYENILRDFMVWAENRGYEVYNHSPLKLDYPKELNGFSKFMVTVLFGGSAGFEDTWGINEDFRFKYINPETQHELVAVYFGYGGLYRLIEKGEFGCHFHDFQTEEDFHKKVLELLNEPTQPVGINQSVQFFMHTENSRQISGQF